MDLTSFFYYTIYFADCQRFSSIFLRFCMRNVFFRRKLFICSFLLPFDARNIDVHMYFSNIQSTKKLDFFMAAILMAAILSYRER